MSISKESLRGEDDRPSSAELLPAIQSAALRTPEGMPPEEADALRGRAGEIVSQFVEARGSKELELADGMSAVGTQAQRTAASELGLLKARVGDLLSNGSAGSQVTRDLAELRSALNQINPGRPNQSILHRLLGRLPFGDRLRTTVEKIALR